MNLVDMLGFQKELDSLALSERREEAEKQVKKGNFDTQKKINDILINYLSSDHLYKILEKEFFPIIDQWHDRINYIVKCVFCPNKFKLNQQAIDEGNAVYNNENICKECMGSFERRYNHCRHTGTRSYQKIKFYEHGDIIEKKLCTKCIKEIKD
ncbi:MAG: hypothetical protein ACXAC2_00280 [Candidatus Kariarchaeaceae archaeon]|jgi:hypothetical protein